jgi:phosphoribosylanthranilate isomerase
MGILVKICGLTSRGDAEAALRAGADFGGLVFFPASPRHIALDRAKEIASVLRGRVRVVSLLVDPDDALVEEAVRAIAPDFIQLHGGETPARVAAISALGKRPIVKVLPVADAADVARAASYEQVADWVLFDAKAEQTATRPGGLGAAFDWTLLKGVTVRRPWGVAGGLTPENVARAIAIAGPALVDASSGVEDVPGLKSPAKIAAFVAAARNAQHANFEEGAA